MVNINLRATPLSVAIDSQHKAYRKGIFVSNQQLKKLREYKMAQTSEEKLQKMISTRQRMQERAREKAKQRQADPEWCRQQRERQQAQARASAARQREKQQSPEYRVRQQQKRQTPTVAKIRRPSKGLKGRTPTAEERRYADALGALPCIACSLHGMTSPIISLHHIDGRTAPDCHKRQLPLCNWHHQYAAPPETRKIYPWLVPVHADGNVGGKKAFEELNASQEELLKLAYQQACLDA